jgi:Ca-activated chloride channel family protein
MNAKRLFFTLMISVLLLSACAPAATQAPIATQPKAANGGQVYATQPPARALPVPTAAPYQMPAPTMAPAQSNPSSPYYGQQGYAPFYPAPAPQDNNFQDYGINPFIDTRRDHLSTFAVDVDTASYTVARRYVMDGSLPPQDAVRVEEFVNYFDPGYNPPESTAFAIYADGAPSPFQTDGTLLLRIGIQGYQVPDSQRKPAALTFVIDISGSMNMENRLGLVKQSLNTLVSRLRRDDTIGIVVFGSEARVLIDATPASRKGQIMDAIDSLSTEGSTNAEAGIRLGFELAARAYRPGASNRVILCSDGVANVGNTGAESILEFVQESISEGISLSTFGFGMGNFNDVLLEQLADKGNGMYAYIDNQDEAQRLFIDNLTSTLQTIAQDAKVQVDFNSDVVARYRLMGYENRAVADQNFRNDSVDAGEIGAGHHVVAMYAVQLNPAASGRLATVQLRWKDPQTGQVTEINGNLNTWDVAQDFNQADPHFQLAATVAQYAELLRGSPWAQTSMSLLSKYASWLQQKLPDDSDVTEFAGLVQRVSLMWHPE